MCLSIVPLSTWHQDDGFGAFSTRNTTPTRYTEGTMSLHPPSISQVRVRYAETDKMGVVYHANYLVWFEIGRVELLRQLGFDYKQMELEDDCHLPVVEASCRYRASARYDDEVVIETRVMAIRNFVVKFGYRALRKRDSLLLAEGETMHVVCDHTMTKRSLPSKYGTAIRAFMVDTSISD
jgi:acyl-CoA thioester hydrolase